MAIFRAPPGCPGVERQSQLVGALDDEEFFVFEGSGGGYADAGTWTPRCQATSRALISGKSSPFSAGSFVCVTDTCVKVASSRVAN